MLTIPRAPPSPAVVAQIYPDTTYPRSSVCGRIGPFAHRRPPREEAATFGENEEPKVTMYDLETEGIVTVVFKEFESAEKFRERCHGRFYANRKPDITSAEDRYKFKKSRCGEEAASSDEERLAKIAKD